MYAACCRGGEGEECLGYAVVVVAEDVALVDEVAGDGLDAKGADAVEVGLDGLLGLAGVLLAARGGDGRGVDEGVVEESGRWCGRRAGGSFRCAGMR